MGTKRSTRRSFLTGILGLAAFLGLASDGCLGPVVPIPPPGITAMQFVPCERVRCGVEGIEVRLTGNARAGSLVVLENLTRGLPGGQRYVAATYASGTSSSGGDGGTAPLGAYEVYLGAVPSTVAGMDPTLSQRGDQLVLYQIVRNSDGTFSQSETSMPLTIPR